MLVKHVKLPVFDGTEHVEGFFAQFEQSCTLLNATPAVMKTLLIGQLKGNVNSWAMGQRNKLLNLTYF